MSHRHFLTAFQMVLSPCNQLLTQPCTAFRSSAFKSQALPSRRCCVSAVVHLVWLVFDLASEGSEETKSAGQSCEQKLQYSLISRAPMAKMQQCYYYYYVHKSLISAWTIWDRCATFRKMKMNNLMSNDTLAHVLLRMHRTGKADL